MAEKTKGELRAEALAALQLTEETPASEIENRMKAAVEAVKAYAQALDVPVDAPAEEAVTADTELAKALREFSEKASAPLERRAREAELETERGRQYPTKARDITRHKAETDLHREFQKASDDLHMLGSLICGVDWEAVEQQGMDAMTLSKLRQLKAFHRYTDIAKRAGMKNLDTTTATGGLEWMDTSLSSLAIDAIRLQPGAHSLFDVWPMGSGIYTLPFVPGAVQTFLIAQIASGTAWGAAAAPLNSTYTTGKIVLNAQKHGTLVRLSTEAEEDAVFPILSKITQNIVEGMAEGRSDICINGDATTGPPLHFDNDTPGALGAAHRRLLATGLRFVAVTAGATQNMAVINADAYRALRRQLGRYKANAAWIVGSLGEEDMASLAQVETMAAAGGLATILQGTVPRLMGYPVVVDNQVREDVANTGINAGGGNTFTTTLLVNPKAFIWGERRSLQVKLVDAPWGIEEKAVYAAERIDFAQVEVGAANNWPVVIGINQAV